MTITITQLCEDSFNIASASGFWMFAQRHPGRNTYSIPCRSGLTMSSVEVVAQLALVTTETSEAVECVRESEWAETTREDGKPEGLPSELADIVIRVAQLAYALDIDLDAAIGRKQRHNMTRSHRHGGKAL
jgi:NTP pyrophosphatase (non-canonical NTP hydrolase)